MNNCWIYEFIIDIGVKKNVGTFLGTSLQGFAEKVSLFAGDV